MTDVCGTWSMALLWLQDYDSLMADLSLQQRADRRRRQQVVSKLPVGGCMRACILFLFLRVCVCVCVCVCNICVYVSVQQA